ncbi:AIM24 family protein [Geoalkalibacter halelectricus]|uniref:AIM24 family protein n=1 Tax=Geoalkalibacter halelectricus TaxID=2847045 RepID=UPI003D1FFD8C
MSPQKSTVTDLIRRHMREEHALDIHSIERKHICSNGAPDNHGPLYLVNATNGEQMWVVWNDPKQSLFSFAYIKGQTETDILRRIERTTLSSSISLASSGALKKHTAPALPESSRERFRIGGHDIQYVTCILAPGEQVFSEAGAFLCRDGEVSMQTQALTDGSPEGGKMLSRLLSPLKRITAGESFFIMIFANPTRDRHLEVSFAAPHPGSIIPWVLKPGDKIICQRGGFLCGTGNLTISPYMGRKPSANLFGSEGLILQELSCRGDSQGIAFIHVGGSLIEKSLAPGEIYYVETGSLAAWESSLKWDISVIKDAKTLLFGKEGLFMSSLTNSGAAPAKAYVQTLPFSRLVNKINEMGGSKSKKGAS